MVPLYSIIANATIQANMQKAIQSYLFDHSYTPNLPCMQVESSPHSLLELTCTAADWGVLLLPYRLAPASLLPQPTMLCTSHTILLLQQTVCFHVGTVLPSSGLLVVAATHGALATDRTDCAVVLRGNNRASVGTILRSRRAMGAGRVVAKRAPAASRHGRSTAPSHGTRTRWTATTTATASCRRAATIVPSPLVLSPTVASSMAPARCMA
jgi:hypothetical protein